MKSPAKIVNAVRMRNAIGMLAAFIIAPIARGISAAPIPPPRLRKLIIFPEALLFSAKDEFTIPGQIDEHASPAIAKSTSIRISCLLKAIAMIITAKQISEIAVV